MIDDERWQGVVNGVLYSVQFEPDLAAEGVAATWATRLLARPVFDLPVGETVAALRLALAGPGRLSGGVPQPHDESSVRAFLAELIDRMEAARPWPTPPYRSLPVHEHLEVLGATAIAVLGYDWKDASDLVGRNFQFVGTHAVLVLELDSGDVVAVVDDEDLAPRTSHRDGCSTLVTTSRRPPGDIVAAFRAATGLTEVIVLPVAHGPN